jgi:hypothetical protein
MIANYSHFFTLFRFRVEKFYAIVVVPQVANSRFETDWRRGIGWCKFDRNVFTGF